MVQETSFILLVYVITFDLLLLWVWKWIEISTLSQLHFKLSLKVWMCCNQKTKKRKFLVTFMSSSCPLTSFFWLLSHMIYLELIKVLLECLLSQSCFWMTKLKVIPKKTWQFGKINVSVNFIIQKFSVSLVRSKSERIESIHFETEEVLLPIRPTTHHSALGKKTLF